MKKILLSLLAIIILFSQVSKTARAETGTWYNQSFQEWSSKVYDTANPQEIFGERYTAAQVQWVVYGLASFAITGGDASLGKVLGCGVTGDTENCFNGLVDELKQKFSGNTDLNDSGGNPQLASSTVGQALSFISQQPMSGVGYILSTASKLHIIPEAKAQGFGFEANKFSLELWKVSRNVAFGLLTIAVVVISFMIMFRVKISPQAVITVQSALPKVILAMILITFSYAITGLLIDFMYVIIGLIAAMLTSTLTPLSKLSWPDLFNQFVTVKTGWMLAKYYIGFILLFMKAFWFETVALPIFGSILLVVFVIMFIVNAIKICILLIKTFVNTTFLTILAPFRILLGTFMQGEGFGPWLRSLAANLAVYPVVALMFFIAFLFLRQGWGQFPQWLSSLDSWFTFNPIDLTPTITWTPPMTTFVGNGNGQAGLLFLALSYSVVHLIPKTAQILKAVMERKPYDYGTAIGESLKAPVVAGRYAAGGIAALGEDGRVKVNPWLKRGADTLNNFLRNIRT